MRAPTIAEALTAWERGLDRGLVERSLELLAMTRPGMPLEALADISVGERDAALLDLREAMFGPELTGRLTCSTCGDLQETAMRLSDLKVGGAEPPDAEFPLAIAGYALRLRVLNSRDLLAATEVAARNARRRVLIERCVVSASHDGVAISPDRLPTDIVEQVGATLAVADPQADIQLAVACSTCGRKSRVPFDIASFLWEEIDAWAGRLLREIHTLARFYGWAERDILELSPARRRRYLELAGA